jgi:broad specificity polyphosphatase/5'/3'-nucleotidase SurE
MDGLVQSTVEVGGQQVIPCAIGATPALAVVHDVLEFAPSCPDLVVSGINQPCLWGEASACLDALGTQPFHLLDPRPVAVA